MRRLDKIPFAAWFLVGCAWWSCKPAETPPPDDALKSLALAVERAERAAPVALAACGLTPPEHQDACRDGVQALAALAAEGRALLDTAATCQEAQDEACLASAIERAAEIVKVLR